jgi:hypothetical protein
MEELKRSGEKRAQKRGPGQKAPGSVRRNEPPALRSREGLMAALEDEAPDYSRVESLLDREQHDEAGRRLFGSSYRAREPVGPLMIGNGAQLLTALSPGRLEPADLGVLAGLSNVRSRCEYEHGFLPKTPSRDEAQRYLDKARTIVVRMFDGAHEFADWIAAGRFPLLAVES